MSESSGQACLECGAPLAGAWCASCGQSARVGRLSFGQVLRDVADHAFSLETPLVRTAIDLTVRPGVVVSEYVAGRRRRYTNPLKYCLIAVAVELVLLELSGVSIAAHMPREALPWGSDLVRLQELLLQYLAPVTVLTLPLLAVLHRAAFFDVDRNVAEHYAATLYVYGHVYLLQAVLLATRVIDDWYLIVLSSLLPFPMLAWASVRFTRCGVARTWLSSLFAQAVYYVVFQVGVVATFLALTVLASSLRP